ncbi:glycosyltransferase [Seohaeicola saemankumensis]|nr:glycosyltransferase family 2 protein [Seohaeicola saemankumensis]MCA0872931.1 glycosyltransferase [Seohaeicola saemankumensis]
MPKASIVVPAFNVAATLPATLNALLAQTFDDFEVIIVDDGSSDSTVAIAEHYLNDPRVRLVRQPNRGLAGARNSGIAAAQGDCIGFCDADDLWEPEKLAAHVAHLDQNPLVGLSFSGSALIDDAGHLTGLAQRPRLSGITSAHVFQRNPVGNGSAAVMRRAAQRALAWRPGFETERDWVFDETFRQSEDIECWLRLSLTTDWTIEGVPGLLTRYRINNAGLSAGVDRQYASWQRMVAKLRPLAPAFFATHEPAARAYQLRYLARRAISDGKGDQAVQLMRQSLRASLRPCLREPLKTGSTLAAAGMLAAFGPRPIAWASRIAAGRGPKPERNG